jgi:hypothetical protein
MWTAVGLTRGQFLAVLVLSVACFAFLGGPVWAHPRGQHFARIGVSYALIPVAVGWVFRRERPFPIGRWIVASTVLALVKLVLTALLLVVAAMAHG